MITLSKTSVDEFNRFLNLIFSSLDLHFIPICENGKAPKVSRGESWKDDSHRLTEDQARDRLEKEKNVGFVPRDDLVVLDIDDEAKAQSLLDNALWDTLTVSTRSGGIHLYFVNGGVKNSDVAEVVEARASWRYVLVPGSYVDPGDTGGNGLYQVVEPKEPTMLFSDDLPEELRGGESDGREAIPPMIRSPNESIKNRYGWELEEVRSEDEKLDNLLTEINPGSYPSPSEADFATCTKLLFWEFRPGQVKDILREYRARPKILERPEYVHRTVRKARSRVETRISDKVDVDLYRPGSVFNDIKIGGDSNG